MNFDKYLTISEIAKKYNISSSLIRRIILGHYKKRKIGKEYYIKIGNLYLVDKDIIEKIFGVEVEENEK